jgi:hypothetical protein
MNIFKLLLLLMGISVLLYTVLAAVNEGPNLFATTIPAMGDFGWQGQFHLDFATYLILSGIWIAWRHRFSAAGIVLGVLAANLGIVFLSVYLLIAINRADGNMSEVLLGEQTRS